MVGLWACGACVLAGCGRIAFTADAAADPDSAMDATSPADGPSSVDAGVDAGAPVDAGSVDGGRRDGGPAPADSGPADVGVGPSDSGPSDAGVGPPDAGPVLPGPALWLRMDDDPFTDGVADDSSGAGRHGRCDPPACPTLVSDTVRGSVYRFDGVDDGLVAPGTAYFSRPEGVTIAFWLQRTASGSMIPFVKLLGATGFSLLVQVRDTGMSLMVPGASIDFSGGPPPTGSWMHVAFTFDGTTIRLYRDGTPAGATARDIGFDGADVVIGLDPRGSTVPMYTTGELDELRVYGRTLTAAEIAELAR